MPAKFDRCRAGGGKIRTVNPKPGKYLHVCIPKGVGSSVAGHVKTKKKHNPHTIQKKKLWEM